jgi:hypothetical protein
MTTDTITADSVRLTEQHTASAYIRITTGLILDGAKMNSYSRQEHRIRPTTLHLGWTWWPADDYWKLTSMYAVGVNILKNGSEGQLRPTRNFISRDDAISLDTPEEFIRLAAEHAPVSKITGEIR